jgi:hypothetical protein
VSCTCRKGARCLECMERDGLAHAPYADEQRLARILRDEGCCFGEQSFTHQPDGRCRCPETQAALMMHNSRGVAMYLLAAKGAA